MKTVLNHRLHRRFTGVEFGALVLSKVEYKRVNASYKISDTSLTFSLAYCIQPTILVIKGLVHLYNGAR